MASHKSFKPKDGSGNSDGGENVHGQKRKNDTHASTTDPDSRLYRKAQGREAKLCYMGHALMENRNGLAVGGMVTQANGTAERRTSEALLKQQTKQPGKAATVGEDKAYDTTDHVVALRKLGVSLRRFETERIKMLINRANPSSVDPSVSSTMVNANILPSG